MDAAKWCNHKYGHRAAQALMARGFMGELTTLLAYVVTNLEKLMKENNAASLILQMLEQGTIDHKTRIVAAASKDVKELGRHFTGSGIIDKCFRIVTVGPDAAALSDSRNLLFEAVLGHDGDAEAP